MSGLGFLDAAVSVSFAMVMAGIVLAFVRLARGPSLADRVVALDMMTVLIVAFCGCFAIASGVTAFLDVAVIVALIGFLATVALARFAERRVARRGTGEPVPGAAETGGEGEPEWRS